MIVVRLYGGLGNQLFQYAAGRRLALWHGLPLHLDVRWFETQDKRRFELDAFDVDATVLSDDDWKRMEVAPPLLSEETFHHVPAVLHAPEHVVLDGYWQSPRYFSDIELVLRADLRVVAAPSDFELRTRDAMGAVAAPVALHVRRGDYVSEAHTAAYHGSCGRDYYLRAMDLVRGLVPGAHFFMFSDDPDWATDNLASPDATTVHPPHDAGPVESLRLMSLPRHHIIANSSFSWWGAWLSDKDAHGVTVAPRPWFAAPGSDTSDLLPAPWITLGNA